MLRYCLKRRKITESKNLAMVKTNEGKLILLSKCAVYDSEKTSLSKNKKQVDY